MLTGRWSSLGLSTILDKRQENSIYPAEAFLVTDKYFLSLHGSQLLYHLLQETKSEPSCHGNVILNGSCPQ